MVTEPAPRALIDAAQNSRVVEVLGSPLRCSYFWKGKITDVWADLLLPVTGPKGEVRDAQSQLRFVWGYGVNKKKRCAFT